MIPCTNLLLNHLGIDNKIIAYHEHNEEKLTGQLLKKLIDVDVVFIALHGGYGEDGTLLKYLDKHNITINYRIE